MSARNLFAELKRRNVYRVAVAYTVVSWLVIQVSATVFPAFNAPAWVLKVIISLLALGFFLAIALAWAFEITAQGIKRSEDVSPHERRGKSYKLVMVTALVAFTAIALLFIGPGRVQRTVTRALGPLGLHLPAVGENDRRSIAVLPFENMSGEADETFFADGIQDDLIARLAKIEELKVISRTSSATYRDPAKRDVREIGQQLGVAAILEGRVRRTADRVLVNVSLIDTADGHQLWADRYDRTLADSLTLQGELAKEIAGALRATLSPEEKARVDAKPTDNPEAYVLYLRARDYQTRPIPLKEDNDTAAKLYAQAIALDPAFALAHARLAATLAYSHLYFTPTEEVARRARAEADEALRLRPDLGEGHLARALCFYWAQKDYESALRELEIAARLLPNDVEAESIRGYIRRRQGRWSEALAALQHSLTRDPRNGQIAGELFATRYAMRNWPEAACAAELAMGVALDLPTLRVNRGYVDFWARGDLASIRRALGAVPVGLDPDGSVTLARWDVALLAGDFGAAERAIHESAVQAPRTVFGTPFPKSYVLGCVALARGDAAAAQPLFEAARPAMEAEVAAAPLDAFRRGHLGLLYAYLGRKEEALLAGQKAVELMPITKDGYDGTFIAALNALIHARSGRVDDAIGMVERLLVTPGPVMPFYEASMTLTELRTRWQWAPLREHPRAQKLLAGPESQTAY